MSQHSSSAQPLRLRNPTPYHLLATNQQSYGSSNSPHPLADIETRPMNQQAFGIHTNQESPASDQIEFNDNFSQNIMNSMSSPLHEYQDEHEYSNGQPMYNRSSFSSTQNPMDVHRRSSTATDATLQSIQGRHPQQQEYNQPVFIPGSSLDSAHSLAMSAPANINYEYGYPATVSGLPLENGSVPGSTGNTARSFEDDYTVQMNMQLMMEKRRRRRESHNAVERRRRDNINDRIQELCTLLPEAVLENTNIGPNNKPNKGAILRKSVDHIRQLQQEVHSYHKRVEDLENTLKMYRQQTPS